MKLSKRTEAFFVSLTGILSYWKAFGEMILDQQCGVELFKMVKIIVLETAQGNSKYRRNSRREKSVFWKASPIWNVLWKVWIPTWVRVKKESVEMNNASWDPIVWWRPSTAHNHRTEDFVKYWFRTYKLLFGQCPTFRIWMNLYFSCLFCFLQGLKAKVSSLSPWGPLFCMF